MSTRGLTFLLSCLLVSSLSAFAQRAGGTNGPVAGTGHSSTGTSSVANSNASFGASTTSIVTADQEGKIKFHTQTILVQVPVIVTDKSGNHIHGLAKEDLHVFENGKEQKLSTFEEIVATTTKLPAVEAKPGQFSNLTLSEQQPRTVTVIAIDTINTPFLDQANGRRELVKFLADNLNSGQVLALMIMTSHGVRVVQNLTGDPEQLIQVLKKASGELSITDVQAGGPDAQANALQGDIPDVSSSAIPTNSVAAQAQVNAFLSYGDTIYAGYAQQQAAEDTLNSFLGIAWSLSGVPGRKSLIWATGGFPFEISNPGAASRRIPFPALRAHDAGPRCRPNLCLPRGRSRLGGQFAQRQRRVRCRTHRRQHGSGDGAADPQPRLAAADDHLYPQRVRGYDRR
jgi:VWFA-related protein